MSFHTQRGEGGVRSRQVAAGADRFIDAAGLGGQLDRFLVASVVDECRRGVLTGRGELDQPRRVAQLSEPPRSACRHRAQRDPRARWAVARALADVERRASSSCSSAIA